jgi:hypothetical protein
VFEWLLPDEFIPSIRSTADAFLRGSLDKASHAAGISVPE